MIFIKIVGIVLLIMAILILLIIGLIAQFVHWIAESILDFCTDYICYIDKFISSWRM